MAPVVALGKPDDLVRRRKIVPVHASVPGFEKRLDVLREHVANLARRRVGDAHPLLAMAARGGDKRQMLGIVTPLHIRPFAAAASDVVAQRRAMLIRRHLQPHDLRTVNIDNHALDHRHHRVARQRIFPRLQLRMADLGADQVHLADASLVLLKRRDLLRIGRPHQNRAVAAGPSGVVRGVAEIFHAVGGELRFLIRSRIAHPQVVIANEGGVFFVRRLRIVARGPASAPSASASTAARLPRPGTRTPRRPDRISISWTPH